MEATKFIREHDRMCKTYDDCKGCLLQVDGDCIDFPNGSPERVVEIVEKWSKEHSIKKEEIKEHCCDNCKYGYLSEDEEPCISCFRCYYDCFEPKEKKD